MYDAVYCLGLMRLLARGDLMMTAYAYLYLNYEFSLFMQANLRTKLTHSMQTNLSNFRRDNDSQVYLPK